MSIPVLYHNPRCSKSRAALALLEERSVEVRVVEYLRSPPTRAELDALCQRLGLPPSEWIRRKEPAFEDAGLGPDSGEDELLDAIAAHPALLERPILDDGKRAVIGRPPERILELLS